MSRTRVTIDRLILKGIAPEDRKGLIDGLRAELSRVLADPVARAEWASSHRTPVLRLGSLPFEAGPTGGRKFGQGLARAIGKGLKP